MSGENQATYKASSSEHESLNKDSFNPYNLGMCHLCPCLLYYSRLTFGAVK